MSRYNRVRAQLSDEVAVGAEDYWKLLLDWPAILDWMRVEGRPVPLVKVELKAGHHVASCRAPAIASSTSRSCRRVL